MKNFRLRHWQPSDAESLVKYANNANIARYMRDAFPHPYTKADGDNFIQFAMQKLPASIFAITVDDLAIGGIGLHPQNDIYRLNAELGYWLGEPFWGQGIITNAISQIVTYVLKICKLREFMPFHLAAILALKKYWRRLVFCSKPNCQKQLSKTMYLKMN